jgi:hypothetical protein
MNTPSIVPPEAARLEMLVSLHTSSGRAGRRASADAVDAARIKSHTRQQISCFSPDGLLRRHDFAIDILGGPPGCSTPRATAVSTASSSHDAAWLCLAGRLPARP